jgi:hypothetical protein
MTAAVLAIGGSFAHDLSTSHYRKKKDPEQRCICSFGS